jgi:hypothetical protein
VELRFVAISFVKAEIISLHGRLIPGGVNLFQAPLRHVLRPLDQGPKPVVGLSALVIARNNTCLSFKLKFTVTCQFFVRLWFGRDFPREPDIRAFQ